MNEVSRTNRFTLLECKEVEIVMNNIVRELTYFFQQHSASLDLALIIGGYGKGEGGIICSGDKYYLKNNIDLLIFPKLCPSIYFYKGLKTLVEEISSQYEILIDLSYMELSWLKTSKSLMAYDLKIGHFVLFKDKRLELSKYLNPFNVKDVPVVEFKSLLVNRGVLLFLNDKLLLSGNQEFEKKARVHISKAIIGLGDFVLALYGQYSWSYCEKNKRIHLLGNKFDDLKRYYGLAYRYRSFDDPSLFEEGASLMEINENIKILYRSVISRFLKRKALFRCSRKLGIYRLVKSIFKFKHYRRFLLRKKRCLELFVCEPSEVIEKEVLSCFLREHSEQNKILEIWASVNDPNFFNHMNLEAK